MRAITTGTTPSAHKASHPPIDQQMPVSIDMTAPPENMMTCRRAQKAVAPTDAMATRQLVGCFLRDAIGEGVIGLVPAIVIARRNPRRRGEHLADQCAAIFGGAQGALRLVPELYIGRKQRRLAPSLRRSFETEASFCYQDTPNACLHYADTSE
jgi:hypothetical protein